MQWLGDFRLPSTDSLWRNTRYNPG